MSKLKLADRLAIGDSIPSGEHKHVLKAVDTFEGNIPEGHKILIGHKLAEMLALKPLTHNGGYRYNTAWGTKTALGLYESVTRIIQEGIDSTYSIGGGDNGNNSR